MFFNHIPFNPNRCIIQFTSLKSSSVYDKLWLAPARQVKFLWYSALITCSSNKFISLFSRFFQLSPIYIRAYLPGYLFIFKEHSMIDTEEYC